MVAWDDSRCIIPAGRGCFKLVGFFSLPPGGGGLGWGVRASNPPTPTLPHQGGGRRRSPTPTLPHKGGGRKQDGRTCPLACRRRPGIMDVGVPPVPASPTP